MKLTNSFLIITVRFLFELFVVSNLRRKPFTDPVDSDAQSALNLLCLTLNMYLPLSVCMLM